MAIRCGVCKTTENHFSVADVRECYDRRAEAEAEAERLQEEAAYADDSDWYDEDAAYDRYRERVAENGSWFGYGD